MEDAEAFEDTPRSTTISVGDDGKPSCRSLGGIGFFNRLVLPLGCATGEAESVGASPSWGGSVFSPCGSCRVQTTPAEMGFLKPPPSWGLATAAAIAGCPSPARAAASAAAAGPTLVTRPPEWAPGQRLTSAGSPRGAAQQVGAASDVDGGRCTVCGGEEHWCCCRGSRAVAWTDAMRPALVPDLGAPSLATTKRDLSPGSGSPGAGSRDTDRSRVPRGSSPVDEAAPVRGLRLHRWVLGLTEFSQSLSAGPAPVSPGGRSSPSSALSPGEGGVAAVCVREVPEETPASSAVLGATRRRGAGSEQIGGGESRCPQMGSRGRSASAPAGPPLRRVRACSASVVGAAQASRILAPSLDECSRGRAAGDCTSQWPSEASHGTSLSPRGERWRRRRSCSPGRLSLSPQVLTAAPKGGPCG